MLEIDVSCALEKHTSEFLLDNYEKETQIWFENLNEIVAQLSRKWELKITDYDLQSRFGCILYGISKNSNIVLKLVPPCCQRLRQEVLCYLTLPYHNMVDLYDYDFCLGGILIRRINSVPISNIDIVADLFQSMFEERTVATNQVLTDYVEAFNESLNNAYWNITKNNDPQQQFFLTIIEKAKFFYKKIEQNESFLLHGDAHIHNILYDGFDVFLIDPIGYKGPFEIEYARFIGTYVRENNLYDISLWNFVERISRGNCSTKDIIIAIGCDVTMRACNTFFEGNTHQEIIDALYWSKRIWHIVDLAMESQDL